MYLVLLPVSRIFLPDILHACCNYMTVLKSAHRRECTGLGWK